MRITRADWWVTCPETLWVRVEIWGSPQQHGRAGQSHGEQFETISPGAVWCCQRCGDASNASAGAELDGTGALFMMQGRRRFREEEMMEIVKQGVNLTGNGTWDGNGASLLYFDNGALAV